MGMNITTSGEPGTARTTLAGRLPDQTALSGVLNALYETEFSVLAVECLGIGWRSLVRYEHPIHLSEAINEKLKRTQNDDHLLLRPCVVRSCSGGDTAENDNDYAEPARRHHTGPVGDPHRHADLRGWCA
jgi:hypothetical protein